MGGHFINQTCLSYFPVSKLILVAVAAVVVLVVFSAISGGDEGVTGVAGRGGIGRSFLIKRMSLLNTTPK